MNSRRTVHLKSDLLQSHTAEALSWPVLPSSTCFLFLGPNVVRSGCAIDTSQDHLHICVESDRFTVPLKRRLDVFASYQNI